MNLLMISGDRALAAGKKGAFYNTLEELHTHFERIDIICPNPGIRRYDMVVFGNVHVHPSPWPLIFQPLWIRRVGRRLMREQKPNLMTVHDYAPFYNGIGAWLMLMGVRIPYVQEIMHIPGLPHAASVRERFYRWLSRVMIPIGARNAVAVRVINQHETPEFLVSAGVPRSKLLYVPAFYIDLETFKSTGAEKKYDLIFVGRMARNKGIDLFLDVVRLTGLSAVVVGEGPLLDRARLQAARYKLPVHFVGFAKDSVEVAGFLNASRLLVMPSLSEGGPRVVLEALSCGTPALATPVGIVPDVLPPEAIEQWNAGDLADKAKNILSDTRLYEHLRSSGLETVKKFERRAAIAAYADALKRLTP